MINQMQKLSLLREQMRKANLAGYMISTTDEYLSEYAPECAKRLEYVTGFTGSNGLAIILQSKTLFFTDGRYLTQAKNQLPADEFTIFDLTEIRNFPWNEYLSSQSLTSFSNQSSIESPIELESTHKYNHIGFDPKIFTKRLIEILSPLALKPLGENLIDVIWHNKPAKPSSKIYDHKVEYCGREYSDKLADVRAFLEAHKLSALLITSPDSVCWLYNLRAHDIEFTPLLLSFALVTKDDAYLFIDGERLGDNHGKNLRNYLKEIRPDVTICDIAKLENYLLSIKNNIKGKIAYDPNTCSYYCDMLMEKMNMDVDADIDKGTDSDTRITLAINDPIIKWKAIKNSIEIKRMQEGHIADAVAVCEFLAMIDQASTGELKNISEYDLGKILTKLRRKQKNYVMDSFPAICGYQDNGAVIHYRADQQTAKYLSGNGLLLVDSGGHYYGATTDITRTVAIGYVSDEYKRYYTAVLRGHLQLAMIKFPAKSNITGANLDVLARQYLWSMEADYAHGTGHGVGAFLGVHEGPHSISLAGSGAKIESGMFMSNEPGYYKTGEFGIRIENVMYAKKVEPKVVEPKGVGPANSFDESDSIRGNVVKNELLDSDFIEFETVTLVPYCKKLINFNELSSAEIMYLTKLYKRIEKEIWPLLTDKAQKWLQHEMLVIRN